MTKFIPSCSPLSPSLHLKSLLYAESQDVHRPYVWVFCEYFHFPLLFLWHYSTSFQSFLWGLLCCTDSYLPTSNSRKLTYISSALYQIWLSSKMISLPSIVLFHWEIRAEISGTPSMVLNSTTYPNLSVTAVNGDMTCGLQFLCTPWFLPCKQFLLPLGLWQHLSSLLRLAS